MSTPDNPKQFHDMLGTGRSLIQQTFDRLSRLIPMENILVATNARYKDLVMSHLPQLKENQILLEPAMRNTAPCILYSSLKINDLDEDGVMIVAPSDHFIENEDEFLRNVEDAFEACLKSDMLMTLGIKPSGPNTGYGYIQFEQGGGEVKKVLDFTEKPDLQTAERFLARGDYLWNAGIFIWSVRSILDSFRSLYDKLEKDGNQNAIVNARAFFKSASGNMLSTPVGKKVVIQGIENFIIVDTEDTLMIFPKQKEQEIKQVSKEAEERFK